MERVRDSIDLTLYPMDRYAESPVAAVVSFSGIPWGTESTFFLLPPEGLESIWSLSAPPQRHKMRSSAGTHVASAAKALISPFRVLSGARTGSPRPPAVPTSDSEFSSSCRSLM